MKQLPEYLIKVAEYESDRYRDKVLSGISDEEDLLLANRTLNFAYETFRNIVSLNALRNIEAQIDPDRFQTYLYCFLERKLLLPIEDETGEWEELKNGIFCGRTLQNFSEIRIVKTYRAKRLRSLYKYIYEDGYTKFIDYQAVEYTDEERSEELWRHYIGFMSSKIYEDLYPVEFPYVPPEKPSKVIISIVTDEKGNVVAEGVYYIITFNNGNRSTNWINRFFKYSVGEEPKEISEEEFNRIYDEYNHSEEDEENE